MFRSNSLKLMASAIMLLLCISISAISLYGKSVNVFTQDFENGSIDGGWTTNVYSGSYDWEVVDYYYIYEVSPHGGSYMVYFNSWDAWYDDGSYLISPSFDLSDKTTATFSFWMYRYYGYDNIDIYISPTTSPWDGTWLGNIPLYYYYDPVESDYGWYKYSYDIDLSQYNGTENYIIIKANSQYGYEMYFDDFSLDATVSWPDAGISNVAVNNNKAFHEGVQPVVATIKNFTDVDLTSANINWSVSLNGTTLYSSSTTWSGYLAEGDAEDISLGSFDFTYPDGTVNFSPFVVTVTASEPNGGTKDADYSNDTKAKDIYPILNDAGVFAYTRPSGTFGTGNLEIWANIKNFAPKPLQNVTIKWTVDGLAQTGGSWTGTLPYNSTTEVKIGSFNVQYKTPLTPYRITAWTVSPNGKSDEDTTNDKCIKDIGPSLIPGVYTIGGSNAHFSDVSSAANYLNSGGIIGDGLVRFDIRPGTYTGQVQLNNFPRGNNTILFNSETGSRDATIQYSPSSTGNYVVGVNGLTGLKFQNLNFKLLGSGDNHVFDLTGGTNSFSLNNVQVDGYSSASAKDISALIYSYNNPASNMVISNNIFNGGSAAFYEATQQYKTNLKFEGNTITNPSWMAVYLAYANGSFIRNNTMFVFSPYLVSYGIITTNGGTITGNSLSGMTGVTPSNPEAGITVTNTEPGTLTTIISNNAIKSSNNINGIILTALSADVIGNDIRVTNPGSFDRSGITITNSGSVSMPINIQKNNVSMTGGNGLQLNNTNANILKNSIYGDGSGKVAFGNKNSSGYAGNNMFMGGDNAGVNLDNSSNINLYYNTINVNSASNPALNINDGNVSMMRNIIFNSGTGPAVQATGIVTGKLISNENDFYNYGSNLTVWNGANYNLSGWQSVSGVDAKSSNVLVQFASSSNLHLVKFTDGIYSMDPLSINDQVVMNIQKNDIDEEARDVYYYGSDNIQPSISIVIEPQDLINCAGSTGYVLTAAANVTYGGIPTYQWEKDGIAISGATGPMFNIDTLTYNMSGTYKVRIGGNGGAKSVSTSTFLVYALRPTEITSQPKSQYGAIGSTLKFEVGTHVYNDLPPVYNPMFQWYNGGTPLVDNGKVAGSKSSILTIRNIDANDYINNYYVVVTGHCGTATSDTFRITAQPGVDFTTQPVNVTECEGKNTELSAVVTATNGATNLVYQWYKNGVKITDDTHITGSASDKLVINNIIINDNGSYQLYVTVQPGNFTFKSSVANITVNTKPVISVQPQANVTVQKDKDFSLTVQAAGTAPLTYQWYKDGNALANEINATLTRTTVTTTDAGAYTVKVTNTCGEIVSSVSNVSVTTSGQTSVNETSIDGFVLMQNIPNPYSGMTEITYITPVPSNVKLSVTDIFGREIAVLENGMVEKGIHHISFNATDYILASGTYYYTLQSGSIIISKIMTLTK